MAQAKKFYAVVKGFNAGVYTTWGECQQNINGFSGAIFKGFSTKQEAEEFMANNGENQNNETEKIARIYTRSEAIAYVDGSYDDIKEQYAYGMVMFFDGGEEHFAEKFSNPEMTTMRNVAGEIEGAKRAMTFCVDNGVKSIDIVYDYEGIEKWCTGVWRTNKPETRAYKDFYNQISKSVKVNFVKVKGHSGDKYNDMADTLAKGALGLGEQQIIENCNGVVANNIRYEDFIEILKLLEEDFEDFEYSKSEIPYGEKFVLTINNPTSQQLSINYYKTKNKLSIQGRKEDLFNRLSLFIVELIDCDEIPRFLNTVHNLNIDLDVIESDFIKYFPNSYDKMPTEVNNYLHQAVYNLNIVGKMYVTNFLVEPAIRSLEAILKIALQDNNIPIRKDSNDYDSFFVFKNDGNRYILKGEYIKYEHTQELLDYLSECYTFFNQHRHTLLHWDNPKDSPDTTRILNSIEEAHTLIKDTISVIDAYYGLK